MELKLFFKYTFVTSAIAAMAYLIDIDQFLVLLNQVSLPYFIIVLLVVVFDQVFMGAKWNLLLRVFKIQVPFWVPVLAYLRGRIFTYVAPSSLGIDAYKFYCVHQFHKAAAPIISSIIVERSFGMLSSLAIILLLLPFSIHTFNFAYTEYIGLISVAGFLALCLAIHFVQTYSDKALKIILPGFFPKKVHSMLNSFVKNLARLKHGRTQVWGYFVLSIAEKTSYGLAVYFSARAIGLVEPGLLLIITIAPIVSLLERLPISVSSFGIREGLFVMLFAPFYDDITIPLTISLVLRSAELIQVLIFWLAWFFGRKPKAIKEELHLVESEYKEFNELPAESNNAANNR